MLATFIRFYHLPQLLHWTMDEEYWSYIPLNIAQGYHFPLIGGSIADTGLYTTPWFVYLMAIVAYIGKGNPLVFGGFVSALGVLTTFLVFFLGKKMFSEKIALVTSVLYAGSVLASLWDRHYWNASLTPILTLLTLFFVFQKRYLLLAITLALAISAHGTGVSLCLFAVLALIWQRSFKPAMVVILILTISFLPVIFFETRHNFLETKAFLNYFTQKRSDDQPLWQRVGLVGQQAIMASGKLIAYQDNNDVVSQLGLGDGSLNRGSPHPISWLFLSLTVLYFIIKKPYSKNIGLLFLLIMSNLLGLIIFRSPISTYYFSPLEIPLFFLVALFLASINKYISGGLLLIFFIVNFQKMFLLYHSSAYPVKLAAVDIAIKRVDHEPFSFDVICTGHCQLFGFRYLFTFRKNEPVQSYVDSNFSWVYQDRLAKLSPTRKVTFWVNDNNIKVDVEKI